MVVNVILLIVLFFQTVMNMTRAIISLYATDLGASTFDIGILTAVYAFFPLIFAIHAGRIADKIGDRLPVIAGLIGVATGMAIPYYFPSLISLYISQLIVGVSTIFITVSLQNLLGNISKENNRDRYYSYFGMAVAFGSMIGPVIAGYMGEHISYSSVFIASIFIIIVPIVMAVFIPVIKRNKEVKKVSLNSSVSLLKIPILRKALIASALVLYSKDIFIAYFPLFAKQYGITTSRIGWIIAIQGFAIIFVRFLLPALTEKLGRDIVLIASVFMAGISFLLVPFTGNVILLGALSALMGLGLGCGQPLSMTTTYNASPKTRTGEVLGLRLASNRLSQLIAPVFFGLVGSWAGIFSVFFISGTFLLGGLFAIKPEKKSKLAS
ncbi:MFS transporter [Bacillus timonensis]|uniref:MFS transporter n=1 Tax=Bacillus timonensis TaxID=1033734 RepID=A0A4S3PNG8_9BACI|nr:MFS transporter [Bacillus timonensis]THE11059.1 MFS transporter [Bacillus timonensis]